MENYEHAKQVVMENLDKLKSIADALLEYETLDAADIEVLMAGGKITRPLPSIGAADAQKESAKEKRPLFVPPPARPVKGEPEPA